MSKPFLAYRAGSSWVRVVASPPALAAMAPLFPAYRTTAAPPAAFEIRVTEGAAGYRVWTPDREADADDLHDALALVEVALTHALLEGLADRIQLHAGAAAGERGAVLFPAASGGGKSTLTAALSELGYPVYGDDIVLLEPESGRLLPFRRLLKVQADVREVLGLSASTPGAVSIWREVTLLDPETFGSGWATPAAVRAVMFPEYRTGAALSLETVPGGAAAVHLFQQSFNAAAWGARGITALAALLDGCEAIRLRYGRTEEAVGEVARHVGAPQTSTNGGSDGSSIP